MRHLAMALFTLLLGCTTIDRIGGGNESPTEPRTTTTEAIPLALVVEVPRSMLEERAAFLDLGAVGRVFVLEGNGPLDAGFPVDPDITEHLLEDTIRLFAWDEQLGWTEIDDSAYDPSTYEVVGSGLEPGVYTAFGWSAEPVGNAMQRLLLDAQYGYRPDAELMVFDELEAELGQMNNPRYGTGLVRDWLQLSFSFTRTNCETLGGPFCDLECGRTNRTKLNRCPENCPAEDGCCECQTFTDTERVVIPARLFDDLLFPCPLCPVCPNGLSCPGGFGPDVDTIKPRLTRGFDYAVLEDLRVDELTTDDWVRGAFDALVQDTVGLTIDDLRIP